MLGPSLPRTVIRLFNALGRASAMQYDLGELAGDDRREEGDKEMESSKFERRGQSGNSFVFPYTDLNFS